MVQPRFGRPNGGSVSEASSNLYVANCGPSVGLSFDAISSAFSVFGDVTAVHPADDTGARVVVCFDSAPSARSAMDALDGRFPEDSVSVARTASELGIDGLYILHEFVTIEEEKELLEAVDGRPWKSLSKRRVQHYGYEFLYNIRNVDSRQFLGELPSFVYPILKKISLFPDPGNSERRIINQLTVWICGSVNEYPPGVGLSPHIDTHSAFDEYIFSLSLAGPCIMEFRKYSKGTWCSVLATSSNLEAENSGDVSNYIKKAIFLPPRSMLLMAGDARYAWHHYIPHHKVDKVGDDLIQRAQRRVSFTFRKIGCRTVDGNQILSFADGDSYVEHH
ncbi:hypothetical protein QJS04_geneDACA012253 [Acorus gramineus]|uniref:Fe2OG dioxygenase domain-containing protein n=1 Tax=Acorus gramineus TaxID=55184 RepID=A0AAV9B7X4_ACOGR|nr:hypothetical protein QJS04_geneDACA012253 [Acorus gramineus]